MGAKGYTWGRFRLCLAVSAFLVAMGFGVRLAEDRQVGYTNDASMWVFVAAGLFAYYAAIVAYVIRRRARAKPGLRASRNKPEISD